MRFGFTWLTALPCGVGDAATPSTAQAGDHGFAGEAVKLLPCRVVSWLGYLIRAGPSPAQLEDHS